MQITQVKEQELALLIAGLRALWITSELGQALQARLLAQLEDELRQRYGKMLPA